MWQVYYTFVYFVLPNSFSNRRTSIQSCGERREQMCWQYICVMEGAGAAVASARVGELGIQATFKVSFASKRSIATVPDTLWSLK